MEGPIPSVLAFLFTMLIKSPFPLERIFIVKPQGLHVLLSEIPQCIYVLCNSLLNNQMTLSFNINSPGYVYIARPNLFEFLTGKENMILYQKGFIYKAYSVI